jgi:hypothetical protein
MRVVKEKPTPVVRVADMSAVALAKVEGRVRVEGGKLTDAGKVPRFMHS